MYRHMVVEDFSMLRDCTAKKVPLRVGALRHDAVQCGQALVFKMSATPV